VSIYDLTRRHARICLEGEPGSNLGAFVHHLASIYTAPFSCWERGSMSHTFLDGIEMPFSEWKDLIDLYLDEWCQSPKNTITAIAPTKHFVFYERSVWSLEVLLNYNYCIYAISNADYLAALHHLNNRLQDEEYPEVIVYFEPTESESPLPKRSRQLLLNAYKKWLSSMERRGVTLIEVKDRRANVYGWEANLVAEVENRSPLPPCTL